MLNPAVAASRTAVEANGTDQEVLRTPIDAAQVGLTWRIARRLMTSCSLGWDSYGIKTHWSPSRCNNRVTTGNIQDPSIIAYQQSRVNQSIAGNSLHVNTSWEHSNSCSPGLIS